MAANEVRFPIVVLLRTRSKNYGASDVRAFIDSVLPAAPDVPVQIAHMAGWGGYDRDTDEALGAFIEAIRSCRLKRDDLYFDFSAVVLPRSGKLKNLTTESQGDFCPARSSYNE
jgi:hypothetical protein